MAKYPSGLRKNIRPPGGKIKSLSEDPSSFVLRLLLSASPYYVSGSVLAQRLKMSRVGVWARISKLRDAGLSIEASQNRGYRLAAEPDSFNQNLLEAWLQQIKKKCKVFVFNSIDSTNSEAERLLANGETAPFAVVANYQQKGRGRMGRSWHSPKTGNLHLSIAFRPNVDLIKLRTFTLWQGICIARKLRTMTGNEDISVKWPNDVVVNGRKIAGMLTEASIDSERVRSLVFGIGININSVSSQFPKPISKLSISLSDLVGQNFRVHEIAANFMSTILDGYNQCIEGLPNHELMKNWNELDALRDQNIKITRGKEKIVGRAIGIDENGAVKVKARNGVIQLIHSGEVTLSKR